MASLRRQQERRATTVPDAPSRPSGWRVGPTGSAGSTRST